MAWSLAAGRLGAPTNVLVTDSHHNASSRAESGEDRQAVRYERLEHELRLAAINSWSPPPNLVLTGEQIALALATMQPGPTITTRPSPTPVCSPEPEIYACLFVMGPDSRPVGVAAGLATDVQS